MRIFIGCLATETNTFAPFPTGRAAFELNGVDRHASTKGMGPFSPPLIAFRRLAEADGHEVVESISAWAQPSGVTVRAVYEEIRDAILADLDAAGEVDAVLLMLHGAMVADGYEDCEGDLLARIRERAPGAAIGAELDPHCHLTEAMVGATDVIIAGKEYPHTDFGERAEELYRLVIRTAAGEIAPVAALVDCRMIGFYPTGDEPMRSIVDAFAAAESRAPILSASLAHGFAWADVPELGARVLVYADADPQAAAAEAERLARLFYGQRDALAFTPPGVEESLDRAAGLNGRVVLGDFADNPGGGAPGDSTFLLRAMVERRVDRAAVGAFWDPGAAALCADAGVGATLPVRLGGKCGPASGDPLDLEVTVMAVEEQHTQGVWGGRQKLGRSVWLRAGGIDIVVCSIRSQVFEPDLFTGLGIDLAAKRLVVVKSSNHYRAGFEAVADHLWPVATPGTMTARFEDLPYSKIDRPRYPMTPDPWAETGGPRAQVFHAARRAAAA